MAVTTLVLFCRRPVRGVGKRRLARQLGDAAALELAELLLAAALEDAATWRGPVVLAPASEADAAWAREVGPAGARVLCQEDGNLGDRIQAVDRRLRAEGAERIVFIGSDAPLLRAADLEAAREALARVDVVLAPAEDGGVVCMGSRRPWPALAELPWSEEGLGAALESACREAGLSTTRTAERADVDRVSDLAHLFSALEDDSRAARIRLRSWLAGRAEAQTVSVVVPVLGDGPELERLLVALGPPEGRFEVLVVDASPESTCRALCARRGVRYLVTRPGRGHQLRLGARLTRGSILWFLHADAEPPPGGVDRVRAAVAGGAAGGCFRFRFRGGRTRRERGLAALVNLRNRIGGMPYGDQGLFFRRDAYEAAGGFADQPLFEEVDLVKRVRRRGRFELLGDAIGVSPRRWERDGWWRRTFENRALAALYALGVPPRTLARHYRLSGGDPP